MKKLFLFTLFCVFFLDSNAGYKGYIVGSSRADYITKTACVNTATGDIDVSIQCPPRTSCQLISSSKDEGIDPIALCAEDGVDYCRSSTDCNLGKNSCVIYSGLSVSLDTLRSQSSLDPNQVGICSASGGSVEDNVIGDALCVGVSVVTGKAGRGFITVIIITIGILFFSGKVSWNSVISLGIGTGALFGAPAIVGLMTGKPFSCKVK